VEAVILVVCTGNVCRSPMAEALLRHHLEAAGLPVPVSSAGTIGWNSSGPTDHTLTALAERGVVLDGHISRRMSAAIIEPAWLVLTMTNDHADAVRNHHPDAAPRTFVVGQLLRLAERLGPRGERTAQEWLAAVDELRDPKRRRALPQDEIRDPLGEPLEAYQALAIQLDDLTLRLAALIAEGVSDTGLTAAAAISQDGGS
jgi:protein-tyrosine phosphatase